MTATGAGAIADRLAIHELAVRYCDATTRGDWAQFESVWMPDATWRESVPFDQRFVGRAEIMARTREMLDAADVFIQICHGVVIDAIEGDDARAHATVQGIGRTARGSSVNYVIFQDRLKRADGVWRYASRDLHNIYVETAPLAGKRFLARDELPRTMR